MEYRDDLANILLSGLPDDERHHVVEVIHQTDAEKLRRKRAAGVPAPSADLDSVDLEDAEYDDDREGAY